MGLKFSLTSSSEVLLEWATGKGQQTPPYSAAVYSKIRPEPWNRHDYSYTYFDQNHPLVVKGVDMACNQSQSSILLFKF